MICPNCNKQMREKEGSRKENKKYGYDEFTYKCDNCGLEFQNDDYLAISSITKSHGFNL